MGQFAKAQTRGSAVHRKHEIFNLIFGPQSSGESPGLRLAAQPVGELREKSDRKLHTR
jgi:hypothetical protein